MLRFLLSMCLVAATAPLTQGEWPQWRGPWRNGSTVELSPPLEWSPNHNVRWRASLPGAGNSSPIVCNDLVIVTASSGKDHNELHLLAFHREYGRLAWERKFFGTPAPPPYAMFPPERGHAVPTPASDGRCIVALFGTGDLLALDFQGSPLWMRSLAVDFGPIVGNYGLSSSPLIAEGIVLVQIDHLEKSYLAAFDLQSGDLRWKTDRAASENWSSPVLAEVRGVKQVICAGTGRLTGYDLSGRLQWELEGLERLCAPTPVVYDSGLVAVSGPAGATMRIDLNGSSGPRTIWTSRKDGPFVPSPVVAAGYCFVVNDQGIVTCRDVKSGNDVWKSRLGLTRPRASLVTNGEVVFCTGLDGTTVVFRAAPAFKELARNELREDVAASPALSHGCLFFRTAHSLICVGSAPASK